MKKKTIVGWLALVIASLALIGAVGGGAIADQIAPPPPVEEKVADTVVRIRDAVAARLKDRDAVIERHAPQPSLHSRIFHASLFLSVLGLIGSGVAYGRREDRRVAVAAGSIAAASLAWHMLLLALGAVVILVIIALVAGAFGGSP